MKCDNCGKDLTNKAVRILPDFCDGKNYYVCDRDCEDSLIVSRNHMYEVYEEIYGNQFR